MRNAVFPCLCLLMAACGPAVDSGLYASETLQPRTAAGEVRIYQGARPECAYQEVGMVTGWPRSRFDSLDEVFAAMRHRARAMGGDAIVSLSIQESSGETVVVANGPIPVVSTSGPTTYSGTVVRFTDDTCAAASEGKAS